MFAAAFWAPRYWAGDYVAHEGADFVPIHVFYVQRRESAFAVQNRPTTFIVEHRP